MERIADVAVIGGGVMGVSIAHHLASVGAGTVELLEKRFIGAGSSGKSGAIIRQHYSTSLLVKMARWGLTTFRDFEMLIGEDAGWRRSGCLFVAPVSERKAMEGNVGLMRDAGARAELLAGLDFAEVAPMASCRDDEIGAWEPEAGYVDPALVLGAFAKSAQRKGVRINEGVEVLRIEVDGGRVTAVQTSEGRISTGCAILCAGPWARTLAARSGLELPLTVIRPQIAYFRRPADFGSPDHPVFGDMVHGFYCRPEDGGRTLAGALDVAGDEVITDPDHYEQGASSEFMAWTHDRMARRIPAMRSAFGRGGYSGLYTLTPDSHPLLGHAPGIDGLYLAVGFSGHGFKLSPAVGRGLAELITKGRFQTLDLSPLRPSRYDDGEPIRGAYEYGLLS
jgi:sarcosine oxidase, subunit beta